MESAEDVARKCYDCTWDYVKTLFGLSGKRISESARFAVPRITALIEADRAATEAKVREEYAGLVEKATALAKGLQNDLWGDINDYNNAVSDVLIELAALGKVSQ
jgi:hypothetical protein